jgi:hypothetical protein
MTIKAQVLAETLFTELVQRKHCNWYPIDPGAPERLPNQLWIDPADIPAFDAKIQLYQFTCILLAVLKAAQTNTTFIAVQEHFERLAFPPTPQQGIDILFEVRGAMKDLDALLTIEEQDRTHSSTKAGRSMFWARDCLSAIRVEESNPVTLSLFASGWMDYYIMATQSLGELQPVA